MQIAGNTCHIPQDASAGSLVDKFQIIRLNMLVDYFYWVFLIKDLESDQ